MGMDVYGIKPKNEIGKYFRNNVWWWHPLANYCQFIAPSVSEKCKYWHSNDETGLDDSDSIVLAALLQAEVDSGRCANYEKQYEAARKTIPKETCEYCKGTGSRTDSVGIQYGLDKPGGCNGCHGTGKAESFGSQYPFSLENVKEFIAFLENCGGFKIA